MSELPLYLVIGSGSIARRHIANLKTLFAPSVVGCISASGRSLTTTDVGADVIYDSLHDAPLHLLKFAVIASPAPFHAQQAAELLTANVPVFIEKPVADSLATFQPVAEILYSHQDKIEIGYNLRYMPSAIYLKNFLQQDALGKIYTAVIDVGQFLPDWRPKSNYRQQVSARKALGGGVLLELSHELDYISWIFGKFESVFCMTSTSGALEIDVEDIADIILLRQDGLKVNLHMDFLQHRAVRICKIVGEIGTLTWDILSNCVSISYKAGEETMLFDGQGFDRNKMYLDELAHFAKVASGELSPATTLTQGLEVLNLVEAMKYSANTCQMVAIRGVSQ